MAEKLRYGNTNTYFIPGTAGGLLVDTDYAGTLPAFYKAIKEKNIKIRDIAYVLATHYHPDHIGLVSELMKQGVKLLLLDTQAADVHFADEIFGREKGLQYEPIVLEQAVTIRAAESRAFLKGLGIDGRIIPTTSHSKDSLSLILDNGECFVGDLEPIEYREAYGHNEELEQDWALVLACSPKVIHYAHANTKCL
ncbi:MAG: MBL fold metallo-hydrolase [Firmicutes bacterium]|nr:MBL fold metallo-hydrolase [Bacillota bacterium]